MHVHNIYKLNSNRRGKITLSDKHYPHHCPFHAPRESDLRPTELNTMTAASRAP